MLERPIHPIPMSSILEPKHRLRENIDAQKLGELADDIAANGLHQPIGVRGPLDGAAYEIIYGHRRFLAHCLLQRATIDARIYPPDYDPLQAAVAENEQREQLTPYEQALIVKRFADRGEPDAAIARYLRRSPTWIKERHEILRYPPELQEAIHTGTLTLAVARALADIDHEQYRASLIDEATRTGATARTVDVWKAHYLADRDRIIANRVAVEEIARGRDAWVLMVPCELCGEKTEYPQTRAFRTCDECFTTLMNLVQREAEAAAIPPNQ